MSSQLLGPISPPEGLEPNFVDPPSRLGRNVVLHAICLSFVTILVPIRVYTRVRIMKSKLAIDDYLCITSYFLTLIFSGLAFKAYSKGVGRHVWDTPPEWIPDALKYFTIALLVYLVLVVCIKLTFLFFYHGLFSPLSKVKHFIYFGIAFVVCSSIALGFATIFNCMPVERAWDGAIPGECFNAMILFYTSGTFSVLTDIYVLILPVVPLWHLNMDPRRKLRALAVFGVGIFACVASIYRLVNTTHLNGNYDSTWNISDTIHWKTIEANTGIVCSCLIFLPAFLAHSCPKSIQSLLSSLLSRLWSCLLILYTIFTECGPGFFGGKRRSRLYLRQRAALEPEDISVLRHRTNSSYREYGWPSMDNIETRRMSSPSFNKGSSWLDV